MAKSKFSVGILIVSDSASIDPAKDTTISSIKDLFAQSYSDKYQISKESIVPDDLNEIQLRVMEWSQKPDNCDLILTSGGTGFSKRDITPEAIKPLLDKEAPGIINAMLDYSLKITPFAIMSRPVAGVRNESLIITLPGSPKGAIENIQSVLGVLDHALSQLSTEGSRELHAKMKTESDHSHGHHHHHHSHHSHHNHHHDHSHSHGHSHTHGAQHAVKRHILSNDLSKPLTSRARTSPYPMIPVSEALALINQHTPRSEIITLKINDPSITGHVIAQDMFASVNVPNFQASIVDGYAVVHDDGPGVYKVTQVSHASPDEVKSLKSGTIARVTTGAVVPEGADAVVPVEETELVSVKDDGKEEDEIRILASGVESGDNIREKGSDIKKGELALKKGTLISQVGGEIGLLASIGATEVNVFRQPKVGVLSTGDELVDLNENISPDELKTGQIFDSNRPLLLNFLRNWGYEAVDLGIAKDTSDTTEGILRKALYHSDIDFIITTGGVSMGELDLLKPTIEQRLNGAIHFGRVAMKPGKPTTFATVEVGDNLKKVIFALPGNPASASVTSHLFVLPSLRKFSGIENLENSNNTLPTLSEVDVVLKKDTRLDPRPEYQRVSIRQVGHELVAESTGFQRSSRVGSMTGSNGLLILPSSDEVEGGVLKAGMKVKAMVISVL